MAKKKRRTAIVPRVVFSVAMGVSVVPSLIGCGSDAPPSAPPAPTTVAPVTVIAAVAVLPPATTAVPVEVSGEIDAGAPAEPVLDTPRRRRRPAPTAVEVDRHRLMGVAVQPPHDWDLLGVAVQMD
jgi:hypothetical protein